MSLLVRLTNMLSGINSFNCTYSILIDTILWEYLFFATLYLMKLSLFILVRSGILVWLWALLWHCDHVFVRLPVGHAGGVSQSSGIVLFAEASYLLLIWTNWGEAQFMMDWNNRLDSSYLYYWPIKVRFDQGHVSSLK